MPRPASARTVASPIPWLPPVTIATLLACSFVITSKPSTFHSSLAQTPNQQLLRESEDDDGGHAHQEGCRHQVSPLDARLVDEEGESDRERPLVQALREDKCPGRGCGFVW